MSSTVSAAATAAASSSSSSSLTGPRGAAATEDGEDVVDKMEAAMSKLLGLTPPTNDDEDEDDETVATLIELYVALTSVFQLDWDHLYGPQQQQLLRASRSFLVNNEEDEEDFYDAPPEDTTAAANAVVIPAEETHVVTGRNVAAAADVGGFDEERHTGRCGTQIRRCVRYLKRVFVCRLRRLTGRPSILVDPNETATPSVVAAATAQSSATDDDGTTDEDRQPRRRQLTGRASPPVDHGRNCRRSRRVYLGSLEEEEKEANRRFRREEMALRAGYRTQAEALRVEHHHQEEALRGEHRRQTELRRVLRAKLKRRGFDPDDLNKRNEDGWIPICYYVFKGNVNMVQYLIARGADCRKTDDRYGWFPMFYAAAEGHLEIIKLLSHDGGAHEDIRRVNRSGNSPLLAALKFDNFVVVQWLLRNEALSTVSSGGGMDDMVMRRDLRQEDDWVHDKRETVLTLAQTLVANHDHAVQLLFMGMVASSKQTASPLAIFNGKSGILRLIADYGVTGSPQQLRTLRQLMVLLPAFIDDTPFVEEEEEDDN